METNRLDELPAKMAHLNIMEAADSNADSISAPESSTRVLRKRKVATPVISKTSNRRFNVKPRKHTIPENETDIESFYLNTKVKTSQTLETIYEEPKKYKNVNRVFGGRKLKRMVVFQIGNSNEKRKKRRARINRLTCGRSFLNREKISMDKLMKALKLLDADEVVPEKPSDGTAVK